MIEHRDLKQLICLNEHRHFRRAADALGLTQPALTKSLQRIEKTLGVQLFDRSHARVTPTTIGEEVIARAHRLLADAEDLVLTVDLMRGLVVGCVAVGIGPAMAESYVTLAIAQLAEEYPKTRITIRVDHWQQLSKWLIAGELDLYVADIADARDDPRTTCIGLEPQQIVWFCRAGHPLCERATVSQFDLLEFPLVTPRMPPWAVRWFAESTNGPIQQDGSQKDGSRSQRSFATVECENYTILKRMVLSSNCISAALRGTLENEVNQGSIVILPVDAPTLVTDAGIVQLSDRTLSPLAAELVAKIHKLASEMALTSTEH